MSSHDVDFRFHAKTLRNDLFSLTAKLRVQETALSKHEATAPPSGRSTDAHHSAIWLTNHRNNFTYVVTLFCHKLNYFLAPSAKHTYNTPRLKIPDIKLERQSRIIIWQFEKNLKSTVCKYEIFLSVRKRLVSIVLN